MLDHGAHPRRNVKGAGVGTDLPLEVRGEVGSADLYRLALGPLLLVGVHDECQEPRLAVALLSFPLVPEVFRQNRRLRPPHPQRDRQDTTGQEGKARQGKARYAGRQAGKLARQYHEQSSA